MCGTCGCGEHHHHEHGHEHHHHHHDEDKVITLEQDILRRNNLLAERNRGYFEAKEIFSLNLMSSPGSGKTTLLEETVRREVMEEVGLKVNSLCMSSRETNRLLMMPTALPHWIFPFSRSTPGPAAIWKPIW